MKNVTYVKGRWYNNGGRIESVASTYQQPVTICCVGIVNQQMPQDTANARLIAAAPDLLAACKMQHEAIDTLFAMLIECKTGFFPSQSGRPWEALLQGNAAIAKAEVKP